MANLLSATRFKSPSTATNPFNVTIPSTQAGSKIVCVAGGGAVVTAKLGVGGANFTKRVQSLSSREVAIQDIVDSPGGTTTIEISLNGPENVDGCIYVFASGALGNFITSGNDGGGQVPDADGQVATSAMTTSTASVIFSMFTVGDTDPGAARKYFGLEPAGKQYANEFIQNDPARTRYWSMIGVSDQPSAGVFNAKSSLLFANTSQHVAAAYEDLTPGTPTYSSPFQNDIARENSLPGSKQGTWFGVTTNANIAGYTDSITYAPGQTVNFKVDSNNTGFNIEVFRQGFYGYVLFGAKRKALIAGAATSQPAPTVNAQGGTECAWSTNATWSIPADATPGIYLYNMRRTDNSSYVAQGIFVVRSSLPPSQAAQVLLTTPDFTWQAYNAWGARTDAGSYSGFTGRNLYGTAPLQTNATRAYSVSFDRPMGTLSTNSTTFHWDASAALVNFLEGNGYDIAYCTSTDIDKNPVIPSRYKTAVVMGHSEYWTDNLRDAYEDARDLGTNLIFLSSNTALWRIRFDPSDTDRRKIFCYKDTHDTPGFDGTTKYDPVSYTGTWRDVRTVPGGVNNTHYRPESGMHGQWFIGNAAFIDTIAVPNTQSSLPIWRNTRVATGGTIGVRGTTSAVLTSAATSINYTLPANTQVGDLIVAAIVTNGNPGAFGISGLRPVRRVDNGSDQTTIVAVGYAAQAGATVNNIPWSNSVRASVAITVYSGAVWRVTDAAIAVDTGGTATHTTHSIQSIDSDMWAICAFGDVSASSGTKTATWTAGSGLTKRIEATTAAAGSGPWSSVVLMDTNGSVSQGVHQYSATAEFANAHASAFIMYLSPGTPLYPRTIGTEWDYVKPDEASTPKNMVMVSEQVLSIVGQQSNYAGNDYAGDAVHKFGMSLYRAESGALVFNSGSWRFPLGLSRFRLANYDVVEGVDVAMQQAVINLLKDMGIAPTTLLSTLENADSTPLVDPGPAATAADYGLTIPTPPVYESLFASSGEPISTNLTDNVDYTLGTVFSSSGNGQVHGIRWFFPDSLPNDHVIGVLYAWGSNSAGTELARVTFLNPQSGWNQALFTTPVSITASTRYVAAVWTRDRYVRTAGQFASGAVASGSLTAPQTGGVENGKRLSGAGSVAYPSATNGGDGYLADVLYTGGGVIALEGWGIPIN